MIIENYEIQLSEVEDDGDIKKVVIISFSWNETGLEYTPNWENAIMQLKLSKDKISVVEKQQNFQLDFLLVDDDYRIIGEDSISHKQIFYAFSANTYIYLCTFDDDGDLITSKRFELS